MFCPECTTVMVFGPHPIVTPVGEYAVESKAFRHLRCPLCRYYELTEDVAHMLEIMASVVVMSDVPSPSGEAVRFARKALGLSQAALAAKLGLTQETISRYETGVFPIVSEYRWALAGLLAREVRRKNGSESDYGRLLTAGMGDRSQLAGTKSKSEL